METLNKSKYTLTIRQITEVLGVDIFENVIFERDPQAQAIISNEKLKKDFIDNFYFREIGLETIDRFKFYLKRDWEQKIKNFDKILIEYSKPMNAKANNKIESTNVFSDTPSSPLNPADYEEYATNINHNDTASQIGISDVEALNRFNDQLRNVEIDFFDQFENLFMQLY